MDICAKLKGLLRLSPTELIYNCVMFYQVIMNRGRDLSVVSLSFLSCFFQKNKTNKIIEGRYTIPFENERKRRDRQIKAMKANLALNS